MSENTNALQELTISDEDFNLNSVSKLADRPNAPSRIGANNLTAGELKEQFDANPKLLKEQFNALIYRIVDGSFAEGVAVNLGDDTTVSTLSDFFAAILSGVLSQKYLKAKRNENADPDILDNVLSDLDNAKVDKLDATEENGLVYVESQKSNRTIGVPLEPNEGVVARRKKVLDDDDDTIGELIVPKTPKYDDSATSKQYVDNGLKNKVSKRDAKGIVYTNDDSGNPSAKCYSVELSQDTIPLRDKDGNLKDVSQHNNSDTAHPHIQHNVIAYVNAEYDAVNKKFKFISKNLYGKELDSTVFDLPLESLKVVRVDDFIDENDNERKLKIEFAEGDPIIVEFDEIFDGIDTLLADKVDKLKKNSEVYISNQFGNPDSLPYSVEATGGSFTLRDTGGHLKLPDKDFEKCHAVPKQYVDEQYSSVEGSLIAYVSDELDKKVNTSDVETNDGNIARRNSSDQLNVPYNPALDQHATSKRYVDNGITSVSKRVDNLEGMLIDYKIDSSEAYAKSVPDNSAPKAILNRVGGKTVKRGSKNICTDAVEGGIPFEVSSIGTIHSYSLPKGTYWILTKAEVEGKEQGSEWGLIFTIAGNAVTNPVTLDEETAIYCEIAGDGELIGRVYPMIIEYTEGTEIPTEYEPYVAPYLEPTKVTEIVSCGVNKFNGDLIDGYIWSKDGTLSYQSSAYRSLKLYLNKGTYTIKFDKQVNITRQIIDGVYIQVGIDKIYDYTFTLVNDGDVCLSFRETASNTEPWNDNNKVWITQGSEGIPYTPYREPITYPIPEEIQNKPRYGEGMSQYYSYIDFDKKKYIEAKINTVELTGDEEGWRLSGNVENNSHTFRIEYESLGFTETAPYPTDLYTRTAVASTHYDALNYAEYFWASNGYSNPVRGIFAASELIIVDPQFTDLESFKDFLRAKKSSGEPVIIEYATGKFEEHDLADILTDYPDYMLLEVDGGGELVAENENKNPVPWTVTFAET